ncbi:MAG: SIR2 family protein [Candidatus Sulfotelmatobacter sp.]
MPKKNDTEAGRLAREIDTLLGSQAPLLFAGAGVSCRVGYPNWTQYMHHLAAVCERYDDLASAELIRQRTEVGHYLSAAAVFKTSELIPVGERFRLQADPFSRKLPAKNIDLLEALVRLPFTAIVTTNYDTALHEACAKVRGYCTPVEIGDQSLRNAMFRREFFIARIHGRADLPETMALDVQDYNALSRNNEYLDFLLGILANRSCLFVGFSFDDPAIASILDIYERLRGPAFPSLHLALVDRASHQLAHRLGKVNIRVVQYDAINNHASLWRAVRSVDGSLLSQPDERRTPDPSISPQHASVHKFMAFAYAQVKIRKDRLPVVSSIQDGIVLSAFLDASGCIAQRRDIVMALAGALGLSHGDAAEIATPSLERLLAKGQIEARGPDYVLVKKPPDELASDLRGLVDGVTSRLVVRDLIKVDQNNQEMILRVLERVFLARAWDLAAHYAGAGIALGRDLFATVGDLLQDEGGKRLGDRRITATKLAVVDLLTSPSDEEAIALARLGRAAFGLQLVVSSPRQSLLQRYSLPECIYLDANVVMPAITSGHPLLPVYIDALERLREANEELGLSLIIKVADSFLNEIVSHRNSALEAVSRLNLEDVETLKKHIQLYGATNTNVFIGAYASFVGREGRQIGFDDFLKAEAPYENELQLATHLQSYGIETVRIDLRGEERDTFSEILDRIQSGYSVSPRAKASVLMKHEAAQLAQLAADEAEGVRSVFVTADNELRRILQRDTRLHYLTGATISHLGLVALVDVMVGLEGDARSLSRLVWAAPHREDEQAIFDYLLGLGLRHYKEGMAMEMQQAARAVALEAATQAKAEGKKLFAKGSRDIARTARFMDRYESKFFENWTQAIERKGIDGE